MMKKLLLILLCLVMIAGLSACGSKSDADKDKESPTEAQKATVWSPKDKETNKLKNTDQNSEKPTVLPSELPDSNRVEALETAKALLEEEYFSYKDLVNKLQTIGYSETDAAYAADHCGADWRVQAWHIACENTDMYEYDHDSLVTYLQTLGFTHDEATFAATKALAGERPTEEATESTEHGSEEAKTAAGNYISNYPFSRTGLIKKLTEDGFSQADAENAADNCGADWFAEAAESAANELLYAYFTHEELVETLIVYGFTQEEAEFGVTQNGV